MGVKESLAVPKTAYFFANSLVRCFSLSFFFFNLSRQTRNSLWCFHCTRYRFVLRKTRVKNKARTELMNRICLVVFIILNCLLCDGVWAAFFRISFCLDHCGAFVDESYFNAAAVKIEITKLNVGFCIWFEFLWNRSCIVHVKLRDRMNEIGEQRHSARIARVSGMVTAFSFEFTKLISLHTNNRNNSKHSTTFRRLSMLELIHIKRHIWIFN